MNEELVILVDENDNQIGTEGKLSAHQNGNLHRAISVFIFNSDNKMLLQRRAFSKYHSGGLWTNACCSHPRPGESTANAAQRRLKEEMGLALNDLAFIFHFTYRAELDNNLIEHELDHVFIGKSDEQPEINPEEVAEYAYRSVEEIENDLQKHPEQFTYWFKMIFDRVEIEASKTGLL